MSLLLQRRLTPFKLRWPTTGRGFSYLLSRSSFLFHFILLLLAKRIPSFQSSRREELSATFFFRFTGMEMTLPNGTTIRRGGSLSLLTIPSRFAQHRPKAWAGSCFFIQSNLIVFCECDCVDALGFFYLNKKQLDNQIQVIDR